VAGEQDGLSDLAVRVRAALSASDVSPFEQLLDPAVTWGPPDDPASGCHNREEVVAWYNRARAAGMAGEVIEVSVGEGALLVGVRVTGTPDAIAAGGSTERWQVLQVCNGSVVDIRGFPDRAEPAARAGISS
jgi:hypothetical protein